MEIKRKSSSTNTNECIEVLDNPYLGDVNCSLQNGVLISMYGQLTKTTDSAKVGLGNFNINANNDTKQVTLSFNEVPTIEEKTAIYTIIENIYPVILNTVTPSV